MFKVCEDKGRLLFTTRFRARNEAGAVCLHLHRTERAAQRCADRLNGPTPGFGTPQGAWDAAAGYHE
jgi:hypothetical protein